MDILQNTEMNTEITENQCKYNQVHHLYIYVWIAVARINARNGCGVYQHVLTKSIGPKSKKINEINASMELQTIQMSMAPFHITSDLNVLNRNELYLEKYLIRRIKQRPAVLQTPFFQLKNQFERNGRNSFKFHRVNVMQAKIA